VEVVVAVVLKGQTFVVAEMPASALKVGKIDAGHTAMIKL
jgi:hypothetical protein